MKRFEHGGDIYRNNVRLDFSANINPFGIPEVAKKALADNIDKLSYYPDPECWELRKAISEMENIPIENILIGNGAADLIFSIVRAVNPSRALLISPSFSEYEKALISVGCDIKYFNLKEENGFNLTDEYLDYLDNIDIAFICNPNNPVGNVIDKKLMDKILEKCRLNNITAVVDECFMNFVKDGYSVASSTVTVKAFTKIYAMAGVRLGYMTGDAGFIKKIKSATQSWNVNMAAHIAGCAVFSDTGYINKSVEYINNEREFLTDELKKLNFTVYNSAVNFILFKGGNDLYSKLLKKGILIRSCENFDGLSSNFYRIAVKLHEENVELINAIKEVVQWQKQ